MSTEQQSEQAAQPEQSEEANEGREQREPQETDWQARSRSWEDKAKANRARVQELEGKVAAFDDISKQLETANGRIQDLEKGLTAAQSEALRLTVAAETGIPASLLTGNDRESLEASAAAIQAYRDSAVKPGTYVPSEGRGATDTPQGDERAFARTLFSKE